MQLALTEPSALMYEAQQAGPIKNISIKRALVCSHRAGGCEEALTAKLNFLDCSTSNGLEHMENPPTVVKPGM